MKKELIILLCIISAAAILRFSQLSDIPPGINRDEGSIGYTAYSLLTTGKDEYGRSFPISFESFGDWKLPLYIYTTVVSVALFGLTEFAVRLPSALAGVATVVLTYFLVKELFSKKIALLTSFLVAVSPWHIHLSRVESESNVAVFLTTAGFLLFLKAIKGKQWLFIPSAISFGLTYYTYAGNHVFTTVIVIVLDFLYFKSVPKTRWSVSAALCFLILFGVIVYNTLFSASSTKLAGIGIFGDPSVKHAKIEIPRNQHEDPQELFSKIVHNRIVFASERFFQNYLNAFSPQFLFIKGGDNRAHNIENFGNMYLIEAPFLLLGFFFLLQNRKQKEIKLVLLWFLVAPLAASITKDAPHTNRMFAIFPILSLVASFGFFSALDMFRQSHKKIFLFVVALLFFGNILLYIDRYFVHFPKNEAKYWGDGYKKLNNILQEEKFKNKKIVMSAPDHSPYIFLLFYQKYSPERYRQEAVRYSPTEDKFVHVKSFGRYEFREIEWGKDIQLKDTVLIDAPERIPLFVLGSHSVSDLVAGDEVILKMVETQ